MPKTIGYLSGAPRVSTSPDAEAAGPRSHILGVIRAFEHLGWDVKPFIVGDRTPASWRGTEAAKQLRTRRSHRLAADCIRLALGISNASKAPRRLGRIDMVYERFASFQALGWPFHRQGIPWILETQGLFYYEAIKDRRSLSFSPLARYMEKWAYKNCDAIVCVSENLKKIILANVYINKNKIIVLNNGVDIDIFSPAKHTAKRLLNKEMIIGFVGSLIGWQGLGLLIEAVSDLRKEGLDLGLVVVGDGMMRTEWRALARKHELDGAVYFTGLVPFTEVPHYLAGFDIGFSGQVPMQSGEMYCSPLKLYEYMAMGKPVIASAYEDAIKTIIPGETGYLFPPGNKDLLKAALHKAFRERDRLTEMGRKARQKIELKHTWVCRVETMMEEIQKVLANRLGS